MKENEAQKEVTIADVHGEVAGIKSWVGDVVERAATATQRQLDDLLRRLADRPDTTKRTAIVVAAIIVAWDVVKFAVARLLF